MATTDSTPAVLTADDLRNLHQQHHNYYTRRDTLLGQARTTTTPDTNTTDTIRTLLICHILLIGATLLLPSPANIILATTGAAGVTVIVLTALTTSRRQHRNLTTELGNIDTTLTDLDRAYSQLLTALVGNPTHPANYQQLEHVLHDTADNTRTYHPNTDRHRHDLARFAALLSLLDVGVDREPHPRIINDIGADNLAAIARWKDLANHIARHGRSNRTFIEQHQHVASILRTAASVHPAETLDLANRLADDDPNLNHHWSDLTATAAALTPDTTPRPHP
jgi:hypothetical protein